MVLLSNARNLRAGAPFRWRPLGQPKTQRALNESGRQKQALAGAPGPVGGAYREDETGVIATGSVACTRCKSPAGLSGTVRAGGIWLPGIRCTGRGQPSHRRTAGAPGPDMTVETTSSHTGSGTPAKRESEVGQTVVPAGERGWGSSQSRPRRRTRGTRATIRSDRCFRTGGMAQGER